MILTRRGAGLPTPVAGFGGRLAGFSFLFRATVTSQGYLITDHYGIGLFQGGSRAGVSMDRETMERFVVRILALVQRCDDPSIRGELMRLADELAELDNLQTPQEEARKRSQQQ